MDRSFEAVRNIITVDTFENNKTVAKGWWCDERSGRGEGKITTSFSGLFPLTFEKKSALGTRLGKNSNVICFPQKFSSIFAKRNFFLPSMETFYTKTGVLLYIWLDWFYSTSQQSLHSASHGIRAPINYSWIAVNLLGTASGYQFIKHFITYLSPQGRTDL